MDVAEVETYSDDSPCMSDDLNDAIEQASIPGTPEAEAAAMAVLEAAGVVEGTPEAEEAIE